MEGDWEEAAGIVMGGNGQDVSFLELPLCREPEVVPLGNGRCVAASLKERQLAPQYPEGLYISGDAERQIHMIVTIKSHLNLGFREIMSSHWSIIGYSNYKIEFDLTKCPVSNIYFCLMLM